MPEAETLFSEASQRFQAKDVAGAEGLLRRVLATDPDHGPSLSLLAQIAGRAGRNDECVRLLVRVIARGTPEQAAVAGLWLGAAHRRAGRPVRALAAWREACGAARDPDVLNSLGLALKDLEDLAGAISAFQRAVAGRPGFVEALYNLATALKDEGRTDEAVALLERVVSLAPGLAAARFALCMAHLPALYRSEAEIEDRRAAYAGALDDLAGYASRAAPGALADGLGSAQPFSLAYQGRDDVELQRRYGTLVCDAMAARYPPAPLPPAPGPDEKIRVGFVSGFFRRHANWNLPIQGWLKGLDRTRFEVFSYHTSGLVDDRTAEARAVCRRFVQGPLTPGQWRAEILADRPHVLIYPEIGMDPMAARLAAQRLAPVQCNAWGHPTTSGLPTLDYFLSSDLMEPEDAQAHYSEALVRLPNLSVYCRPPAAPPPVARNRAGRTTYWCAQTPAKYRPAFDSIFPRIAAGAGNCQFVFVESPGGAGLTQLFKDRLSAAFTAHDLEAGHYCRFLPRMTPDAFVASLAYADIILDSVEWSGCNTLFDSLAFNLPIVTVAGRFMRGRHALALLKRMGLADEVAADVDGYVDKAVRLARDPAYYSRFSKAVEAGKARLFGDETCLRALEDVLTGAVRRRPA